MIPPDPTLSAWLARNLGTAVFTIGALAVGVVLARRNIKAGRSDTRGAMRLAFWFFIIHTAVWAMWASHVADLNLEWAIIQADVGYNLFLAANLWLLYVGLEPYVRRRAIRHLEQGRVVIFAAGTGNPFFTTDTAATLRGMEIGADVVLKATKVDGVYDRDPVKHPDAKRFETISFDEVLEKRLGVMDAASIALCRDQKMHLRVFSIQKAGNLLRVCRGEDVGTLVKGGQS